MVELRAAVLPPGSMMLGIGALQRYLNADVGPTAKLLTLVILNLIESPKHMAGNGGIAFILNCGTTVTPIMADPEHIAVFPVTVNTVVA
jgi:hypothetical protein